LVVLGCVSAGFVISAGPGLVARAAEPDRWLSAIASDASSVTREGAAQRRIAELEQRIKELEAQRGSAPHGAEKSPELAAAVARNQELAARNVALSLENQQLGQSRMSQQATCEPPHDMDPRAQLRYWAKQIRDGESVFGRLSPERNAAVNVLLR